MPLAAEHGAAVMFLSRLDPDSRTTMRFTAMRLLVFIVMALMSALPTSHPVPVFVAMLRLLCGIGSFFATALALLCRVKPGRDHLNIWDEALIFLFLSLGLQLAYPFVR